MFDIETRNERERGCGFRKEGGIYLMAGEPNATCGRLPLALERCPCCDAGIKPSRGWTWVNPKLLLKGKPCEGNAVMTSMLPVGVGPCDGCPMADENLPDRVGLLWIGERYYKTPGDFLKEGIGMGLSRRLSAIPKDFVLGETVVWFAHRKAILKGFVKEGEDEYTPGVFGSFKPTAIEYVVPMDKCGDCAGLGVVPAPIKDGTFTERCNTCDGRSMIPTDPPEKLERLVKRGVTLVTINKIKDEEPELFVAEGNDVTNEV